MHILMTADTVGGVWNYALELTRALAPHGGRVSLATMGREVSARQRDAAAALPNLELHESRYALEWMAEPWEDVQHAGEWLLELEQRLGPDVVQLNGYAHGVLPFSAPVVIVAHSCVLSWWRAVKGEPAPREWDLYHRKVRDGLAGASAVIAPTAAMLGALELEYGTVPGPRVIPNGCSMAEGSVDGRVPMVLSAGRLWDDSKNVMALDRVAPRLGWPVYVAGETRGPEGHLATPQHACALGALDAEELGRWMRRAAIYALPARYEPFGLSVLEAARSGCALVLSDIPTLRELWEGAAVLVAPESRSALLRGIADLIRDDSRRRQYAAAALERARTLTAERMASGYMGCYESLAAAGVVTGRQTVEAITCAS